jgi:predicted N-acetyltransferase YhbS
MTHSMPSVVIRLLNEQDCMESLTTLIHAAYEPHAKSGLRYWATHQSSADTRKRFASGIGFVANIDHDYVGTITLRPPKLQSEVPLYCEPGVWSIGQFAVSPQFKGLGIGKRLHDTAVEYALQQGGHTMALDTAAPATSLINKYLGWGYRIVGHCDWRPHTNYLSVLMSRPLLIK